jgi:hypothetical protein
MIVSITGKILPPSLMQHWCSLSHIVYHHFQARKYNRNEKGAVPKADRPLVGYIGFHTK